MNNNSTGEDDNIIIVIRKVETVPGIGESGFSVEYLKEFNELGLLLDIGNYFTELVRGQIIRTRAPSDNEEMLAREKFAKRGKQTEKTK